MGTLGGKKAFQTERKADAKALREMPGIWSRRAEASVSGTKWETGERLAVWSKRGQGPGHVGLVSHGKGFRVAYV